jgi:hypothetical protein
MHAKYDPHARALMIRLADHGDGNDRNREIAPGAYAVLNAGELVAIELLGVGSGDATQRLDAVIDAHGLDRDAIHATFSAAVAAPAKTVTVTVAA